MEHTELYELLGVGKDATDDTIKKNYHKLAKEYHPDKNPEAGEKFKEIAFAYEVLSNPEKRKVYDIHGLKGLQESNGVGFSDASEFFTQWFPFSSSTSSSRRPGARAKTGQIVVKVEVTLEEIFQGGVMKKFNFKRTEFCPSCQGQGGPAEAISKCLGCGGVGRTANYAFMGGFSAFESVCAICYGRGNTVAEEQRCIMCSGSGLIEVEQTRDVEVPKGAPNMMKISFPAEGSQPLVGERVDVIVVLVQAEHDVFARLQNDLLLRETHVSLAQALCGFVHCFRHLDGRNVVIATRPGEVIRHGEMKMVTGEGMPLMNNPLERGNLFVDFRVEFPENNFATPAQIEMLEKLLPPRETFVMPEEAEEVDLVDPVPYGSGAGAHGIDDDDEEHAGGPQFESVQCQAT